MARRLMPSEIVVLIDKTIQGEPMKPAPRAKRLFLIACVLSALALSMAPGSRGRAERRSDLPSADAARLAQFEQELESLRQYYNVPGLSAVIVSNQRIIWEKGFGFQDIENRVPATPDTPYHIASLTKTFASMLVMKCVEQSGLNLNDPISWYTAQITQPGVSIRHVFTHTSESVPPGERYNYNGNRYVALTSVVDACSGEIFRVVLARTILDRLEMWESVPGRDLGNPSPTLAGLFTPEARARYAGVVQRSAKPYQLNNRGELVLSAYPETAISASSGLISTARDLARYDAAIDRHLLLQPETQETAWTNHRNSGGQVLPYGLGWFVQSYLGERLVWHYGNWPAAFSSLILKVPGRNLTLILLANSGGLSTFSSIGAGNIAGSPFAGAFLNMLGDPEAFPGDTTALVSAASYRPDAAAPEAMVAAFGQKLATGTGTLTSLPLPTELAGTSVRVDGVLAPLFFVSPQQINFLIPAQTVTGIASVEITAADGTVSRSGLTVAATAPAIFTANAQGNGAPAALATVDGVSYKHVGSPDGMPNPIKTGDFLILFGTGIRGAATGTVKLTIGGAAVPVLYAGKQADFVGLDQVNTQIPAGLSGDVVATLSINGRAANPVRLSISQSGQ
jgi:uncharacterized protein (TIGR03437 family)